MKRTATTFAMMGALLGAAGWGMYPYQYPLGPVKGSDVDGLCACSTPDPNRRGRCRRCHKDVKP